MAVGDAVVQVMRNQHEDLLKHLDSRLDSLCRRIQKENSFIPVRSGSRLQSQTSRLTQSQSSRITRIVDPSFSPSLPASPSRRGSLKSSFLARAMTTTMDQAEKAFERNTSHESEADAMPALTHKASDSKSAAFLQLSAVFFLESFQHGDLFCVCAFE